MEFFYEQGQWHNQPKTNQSNLWGGQYHRRRGSTSPEHPIIFSFPKNMNIDDLQDLTDLFEYKELTRKSKAN